MGRHTIEVTEISDELIELLDERIRQTGGDRASFVRDLIRRELQRGPSGNRDHPHAEMSFEEILRPVHEHAAQQGISEEKLEQIFEEARSRTRQAKGSSRLPVMTSR